MTLVPAHMKAMYKLVEQRGGLQNVKTPGVVECLAL